MGDADQTEVELLEEMFHDRFTENDAVYMDVKSKSLSQPPVIYPWRLKKQFVKNWDYSGDRRSQDRNRHRSSHRDHHGDNSHSHYRDRSRDGESSKHRDDHRNSYRRRDDRR